MSNATESVDRTQRPAPQPSRARRVLVTGSSGLVGTALLEQLSRDGRETTRLVRSAPEAGEVHWDPSAGTIDERSISADAVVHLAGENIAAGRWTRKKMEAIRSSRVRGTQRLAESLARLPNPPAVLVSASAIGFYADSGADLLTERSPAGSGFLADVCREWEGATKAASDAGIRVVNLRIGIVLARAGGALAKMLFPFQLGLGGRIGDGRQYMSWIALDDLVRAIGYAIDDERLVGPVNATAPHPVTNAEFTRTLGTVLNRPTVLPVPALAARVAFGRMADALLLASLRVGPQVLLDSGFEFHEPRLEGALRVVLGRAS